MIKTRLLKKCWLPLSLILMIVWAPIPVWAVTALLPAILYGQDSSLTSVPYQVKLLITRTYNSNYSYSLCGGVMVDNDLVLTAAHCLEDSGSYTTTSVLVTYLDYTSPSSPTQQQVTINAANTAILSGWTGALSGSHDIAVIYSSGAAFTNAKKIKIASSSEISTMLTAFSQTYVANQDNDTNVLASGYGEDEDGVTNQLQRVLLTGMPASTCSTLKSSSESGNDIICVQSPSTTTSYGICRGDSGGPLVWQNPSNAADSDYGIRLVGIASYVTTDGGECRMNGAYYYGGYSSISYFSSEINTAVNTASSGSGYSIMSIALTYSFDENPMSMTNTTYSSPASSDGGGGGAVGTIVMALLATLAWYRRARKSSVSL